MKLHNRWVVYCATWATFLVLISCAGIKPPPGGDEDKTPPLIDTTFPATGTTNVPLNQKLTIRFQQNLDRQSLMQSVTMTPYINGIVKYDWSGYDEVHINLPENLRPNTTYVLTFGKDLKTRRAGRLETPIQVIFSTGSVIDSGRIAGTVLPSLQSQNTDINSNVYLFAYDITEKNADTLNFSVTRPDLLTQPSSNGAFEFRAVKTGRKYRIIAIQDEFRNKLYDHTIDAYGVLTEDIQLDETVAQGVVLRLSQKIDTTKPFIQDVEALNAYQLKISISKKVDSTDINNSSFKLTSAIGDHIQIAGMYRESPIKRPAVYTVVTASPLFRSTQYILSVDTILDDEFGNRFRDSGAFYTFLTPPDLVDTFPDIVFSGLPIADSSFDVHPMLNIILSASGAIRRSNIESSLEVQDSAGNKVPIIITSIDDSKLLVKSRDTLKHGIMYEMLLDGKSVLPISPTPKYIPKDTMYRTRFYVSDNSETGVISGSVDVPNRYDLTKHRIVVELIGTDGIQRKVLTQKTYRFSHLRRGEYQLRAYITGNSDNSFDGGSILPFHFALPSGDHTNRIEVRPRWSVDGVTIELK